MAPDTIREFRACLALRHTQGLGSRTWHGLLEAYGSAAEAVERSREWVARKLVKPSQAEAFESGAWRGPAALEEDRFQAGDGDLLLHNDPGYPALLRATPNHPLFLYLLGDAGLLANPAVAIVGSRDCTRQGRDITAALARGLSGAGVTVVSGMAWGIDRQAHLAALEGVGSSMAVLGTGLDLVYPKDNRDLWQDLADQGLLLTEFPPGTGPLAANFPQRNRIIAGLSLGVVVAEAPERSGALITAQMGLEYGREVFAVAGPPGVPSFEGCRLLAEQGARTVHYAEEVLAELAPQLRWAGREAAPRRAARAAQAPPAPEMDPDEEALYAALGMETLHIDALARGLGWDAARVSRTLLPLEVRGLVMQRPGMRYRRA